jgi:hypothetical protein
LEIFKLRGDHANQVDVSSQLIEPAGLPPPYCLSSPHQDAHYEDVAMEVTLHVLTGSLPHWESAEFPRSLTTKSPCHASFNDRVTCGSAKYTSNTPSP